MTCGRMNEGGLVNASISVKKLLKLDRWQLSGRITMRATRHKMALAYHDKSYLNTKMHSNCTNA